MNIINYKDVYELYVNQGLTYKEIGYKYGVSSDTVRKIAKRHGIKSIRGKSKHRKIIIQKSKISLSLTETDIYKFIRDVSENSLQVILGSLLGDSSMKKRINKNDISYNVYFSQSNKQIEYLKYKRNLCEGFANDIREERESGIKTIKNEECYQSGLSVFSTFSHNLSFIYDNLYIGGVKTPNIKYLSYLTPLSLAIWYMDDGSYNVQNRIIRFATMRFSKESNNSIKDYFYNYLKMPCFLEKTDCGSGVSIALTQNSTKKFLNLTMPYKCDYMNYKFLLNPSETLKVE